MRLLWCLSAPAEGATVFDVTSFVVDSVLPKQQFHNSFKVLAETRRGPGRSPLRKLNDFPVIVAVGAQDKKRGVPSLKDTANHGPRIGAVARAVVLTGVLWGSLLGGLAYAFWPNPGWQEAPAEVELEWEQLPHPVDPRPEAGAATDEAGIAPVTLYPVDPRAASDEAGIAPVTLYPVDPRAATDEAGIAPVTLYPVNLAPEATEGTEAAEIIPAILSRTLRVAKGDTLMGLLTGAGIERREAHEAITALSKVFSPRKLMPGQEIHLALTAAESPQGADRLVALTLQPSVERDFRVTRAESAEFVAESIDRSLLRKTLRAVGTIESSLTVAGEQAGVPIPVMVELIRIFSFDVDFQREIRRGDDFEVLYEALYDLDGNLAKTGPVLYAALTLSGTRLDLYGFTASNGFLDYFDPKGRSVRKTLMRTPIDGARLSSSFGMRRHPMLRYSKMHRGTDFAAPRGTPIYAAGDGVVEFAGPKGASGRYVRIRHNATYKTAYAHMRRIAKGVRRGRRVRQGQIIGYVGSTGRSTGPHLHYEVLSNGRQVNPMKIKLPSGETLKAEALELFNRRREELDRLRAEAPDPGKDLLLVQVD